MFRQLKIEPSITSRDSVAVEKYLQEISKIAMVTPEEEVTLTLRIKQGDEKALDTMIRANLRFVVSVAKQYQHRGLQFSDLINEGNLGLIKAASRFDETRGFKFISYAVWWIRQSITAALEENARIVRLPSNKIGVTNKIYREYGRFEQKYDREPSVEELADILVLTESEINISLQTKKYHSSLDAPLNDDDGTSYGDSLKGNVDIDPDQSYQSLQIELRLHLLRLNDKEREIVSAYFGIDCEESTSLEQIARKYNLTKERIRQIKERALKKLKRSKKTKLLKPYLGIS